VKFVNYLDVRRMLRHTCESLRCLSVLTVFQQRQEFPAWTWLYYFRFVCSEIFKEVYRNSRISYASSKNKVYRLLPGAIWRRGQPPYNRLRTTVCWSIITVYCLLRLILKRKRQLQMSALGSPWHLTLSHSGGGVFPGSPTVTVFPFIFPFWFNHRKHIWLEYKLWSSSLCKCLHPPFS
jgi:hypothetical protein